MWEYEFYEDDQGKEPVKNFLLSLDKKRRGKLLQIIQILSEFGTTLPFPYSSHVEGKIRELRTHYGRMLYRILYYQDSDGIFVLLHAFKKNSKKIPKKNLRIAKERLINNQIKKGEKNEKKKDKGTGFYGRTVKR